MAVANSSGQESSPEARARELLESVSPYLQSDGLEAVFNRIEDETLYITIRSQGPPDPSLIMLSRLGIERKLIEANIGLKRVTLV